MAGASKTREFFASGSANQFEWVLGHYDEALRMKAESKSSKPENVIKLDKWYQTELPKKIKSRGKEAHLLHDELVQTIKWKLARGKFQANMVNLIQMNTPRVVMTETKKAFRNIFKRGSIESAAQALCNLKGVGPTMASAVLAAGAPHLAPFMADECLLAMPDGESLDYTMKEYMRFVEYVQAVVERLKAQGGEWDPHKVELAVWTHYILNELKPELLIDMPGASAPVSTPAPAPVSAAPNGASEEAKNVNVANGEDSNSASESANGDADAEGDEAKNGDFSSDDNDANHDRVSSESAPAASEENATTTEAATATSEESTTTTTEAASATLTVAAVAENSEIHLPATNGNATTLHENGKKEDPVEPEPEAEEVSEAPTSDLAESEKRIRENDVAEADAADTDAAEPATKKFKPDEQPEAIATAVV